MYSIKSNLIWMLIFFIVALACAIFFNGIIRTVFTGFFNFLAIICLIKLFKLIFLGKDYRYILRAFKDGKNFKIQCDFCENKTDLTQTIGTHLLRKPQNKENKVVFVCITHGNEIMNKVVNQSQLPEPYVVSIKLKAMKYANVLLKGGIGWAK